MLTIAFLMLQATAPEAAQPAAPATPPAAETTETAAEAPEGPKMKRVCKKVIDSRVGTLGSRTLKCKYVPADPAEVAAK